MPELPMLSLSLAVACVAGVNLYLTVFILGLAGRIGWLPVEGEIALAGNLSHPAVMTVALLLYLLQAIVDKVPAMDSLWDALHTVIRPAGAVVLALQLTSNADTTWQALAGMLAGAAALTTHLAKSAVRLTVNNSPGPVLNILLSIGEDLLVLGILSLTIYDRAAGLWVCLALIGFLWLFLPRIFRAARAGLFFLWKKLRLPAGVRAENVKLPDRISARLEMLVHSELPVAGTVRWALSCVTGRIRHCRKLKPNTFGTLISLTEHPSALIFTGRRWFRDRTAVLLLSGCETKHESEFLSENLVVYNKAERHHVVFRFTRAEQALTARLAEDLHALLSGVRPDVIVAAPASEPLRSRDEEFLTPLIMETPETSEAPPAPQPGAALPDFPFPSSTLKMSTPAGPASLAPQAIAGVPPMPVLATAEQLKPAKV